MGAPPPRYRFGPRSTRGLVAGWRGGQLAVVAVAALLALGLLRSIGGVAGALLALLLAAVGVAIALVPVAGRPVESWAPTVGRFAAASLAEGTAPWRGGSRPGRKGPLSRLELRFVEDEEGRPIGVVVDKEAATWSAALAVGGEGYALLDEAGKGAAVASWAGVLSAMAAEGRGLHRLQWIARTYRAAIEEAARPQGEAGLSEAGLSYKQFLSEVSADLFEREVLVVVTTAAPRPLARASSRAAGEKEAVERLSSRLSSLAGRLNGAGLVAGRPLDGAGLAASLRRSYECRPGGLPPAWPFPLGIEARWAELRTDSTWQATYWISEWPRGEVGPGVLLPLLLGGAAHRAVSVTMAPLAPVSAVRRAERERTSGAADAELRRRHGFALTARDRAEHEVALQREAELAEGHAAYLFSGYVAVTAPDESALEEGCGEVEQAAAIAQLELRRVYGAQEEAWCCTLPLGRGCR